MTRAKDISKILTDADISGNIDVDGVTNLDVVDIDGAVDMASTLNVTGAITSSAGATITTADNSKQLILKSTDADANVGPVLELKRDSSSPADNDYLGYVRFVGENDASEETVYAQAFVIANDVSDGTEDATFEIDSMVGGNQTQRLNLNPTETVFNEGSADIDFRVESNGDANCLFVDGANDKVGIGTNSPDTKLQIKGSVNSDQLTLGGTDNRGLKISTTNVGGQNDSSVIYDAQDTEGSAVNSTHIFKTGGSEKLRIHGGGQIGINNTTSSNGMVAINADCGVSPAITINDIDSSPTFSNRFMRFADAGATEIGNIIRQGSSVAYSTTSDYRLKENVTYDFDASTRLKQLKPCRFNFIADGTDRVVDGFLAHEVSSIVPEAISGEKDAMTEEVLYVDGDQIPDGKKVGDVKEASQINPQGIDQSKLVPLLVKTIQELEARITVLESA